MVSLSSPARSAPPPAAGAGSGRAALPVPFAAFAGPFAGPLTGSFLFSFSLSLPFSLQTTQRVSPFTSKRGEPQVRQARESIFPPARRHSAMISSGFLASIPIAPFIKVYMWG